VLFKSFVVIFEMVQNIIIYIMLLFN